MISSPSCSFYLFDKLMYNWRNCEDFSDFLSFLWVAKLARVLISQLNIKKELYEKYFASKQWFQDRERKLSSNHFDGVFSKGWLQEHNKTHLLSVKFEFQNHLKNNGKEAQHNQHKKKRSLIGILRIVLYLHDQIINILYGLRNQ